VKKALILLAVAALGVTMAAQAQNGAKVEGKKMEKYPSAAELKSMAARFAPAELKVDVDALSAGDQKALAKLIEASRVVDDIFMDQYWSGNRALLARLKQDQSELGKARLEYFWINKSPWSALDGHTAFMPGVPAKKLEGANFYPVNMTRNEFESWAKTLPEAERTRAVGFFSVIRRGADLPGVPGVPERPKQSRLPIQQSEKTLVAIPFSTAYHADLMRCATLLREAAQLTDNATLKTFLNKRADAFLNDDYYDSDVAWMDLDAPIDVTIGPYETYNDEVFGYKASFEAYINLRDDHETQKVSAFSRVLQEIENNLPIDATYKNPKLGASAPIRVVNQVIGGGDGAHGVQTAAYNLPNDERITTERGTKRVMLRNVQEAKFQKVLVPMAARALNSGDQANLSFDWFFTHILAHELSHGIGPHQITVDGKATTPRERLKELYSSIEEAKADVLGLFALQYMIEHSKEMRLDGVLPAGADGEKKLYTTYLASTFRSLGFGLHEAHAKGMAIQVNYLSDHGAIVRNADGKYSVDVAKMKEAVRGLAHDLLMLEATGDYDGAKKLLGTAVLRPDFEKTLAGMKDIPTDIKPWSKLVKEY
jgi:hypothetical protein